jgi:hypothetical protein
MLPIDPIGSVRFKSIVNVNGSLRPLKSRCSIKYLSLDVAEFIADLPEEDF